MEVLLSAQGDVAARCAKAAALGQVYEFDLGLCEGVEAVRGALQGPIAGLIQSLDALDARLTERDAILGGFK